MAVWRRGDTAPDVVARAEQLLDAATQLGGNHTRGPKQDVLVYGHPRLGVTAFSQLLELDGCDRRPLPDRAGALPEGRAPLP